MVCEQEDAGLEAGLLLDREGLGRDIALHHRLLVGQEGRGVEGVGANLLVLEAELRFHPLEVRGLTFLGQHDVVGLLEVKKGVVALARMGDEALRLLLENRGDDHGGHVFLHGQEGLDHVAAHVVIEAARQQHQAAIGLRPAHDDFDIEAGLGIGAVGNGLIIPAVFGLGEPVGAEADLVAGLCQGTRADGEGRSTRTGEGGAAGQSGGGHVSLRGLARIMVVRARQEACQGVELMRLRNDSTA